jgi:phosphonopyruvate decarboxylase
MAISPKMFYKVLEGHNIEFFTGVPDSLLAPFCLCLDEKVSHERHIIAANEGNAVAIASGYHLATGKIPLVYMQNSGLGNSVNPLLSLCDPDVYSIPMILLIGWRGEPGFKDEPQHIKQGKVQLDLLNAMDIPYEIISKDELEFEKKIMKCIDDANMKNRPTAILVKKGTFEKYSQARSNFEDKLMTREEALEIILAQYKSESIIVSTTGKTSREIFEIRKRNKQSHFSDFLTVGSMGHCSSIALGIAMSKPHKDVVCIDGDGALIMHMGSLATIGNSKPKNLCHILINNYSYESVGGQETSAKSINMLELVRSNGYLNMVSVQKKSHLKDRIQGLRKCTGPSFLEVIVKSGSKANLGRPTIKPIDNKKSFMNFLKN